MSRPVMRDLFVSFVDQVPQRLRSATVGNGPVSPWIGPLNAVYHFVQFSVLIQHQGFELTHPFILSLLRALQSDAATSPGPL
jgi:hypothetical protein